MFNHVKDQYVTISTLLILGSWLLSSWEIYEQFNNESSLTLKYFTRFYSIMTILNGAGMDGRKVGPPDFMDRVNPAGSRI